MNNFKIANYLILFILSLFLFYCQKNTNPTISENNTGQSQSSNDSITNTTSDTTFTFDDHDNDSDYIWDESSVIKIQLSGSSISIDSSNYAEINGSTITISSYGNYEISGTLNNGQILVDIDENSLTSVRDLGKSSSSEEIVRLILNGVNITNSTSSSIFIKNSSKTLIVLNNNTDNYLTDGSSYVFENAEDDEPNAALFSKDDLTIFGEGTLNISANYNDGISSKDGLIIKSGNINVTSVDDGIRGKDYLIIRGGNTTVNAKGDGLKSDNEEDVSSGFISIENGTLNIISSGDGITAQTNAIITDGNLTIKSGGGSSNYVSSISSKGIKAVSLLIIDGGTFSINSADDAVHSNGNIIINGGTISLSTGDDGIHADNTVTINSGNINIEKSVEGVEGNFVFVNDGNIHVASTDDSFNSSAGSRTESDDNSCIFINGGYIVLVPSNGDGLDSNGDMEMSGGTVIIHGPSNQPEVMIDYNGTFNISGGFLISSGSNSNMTQAPSSSSSQCAVKIMFSSSISASTIFHVQDSDGNKIVTFQPSKKYQSIVFSASNLQKGKSYTIFKGGSSTGTLSDGLYNDGTYSGGTLYKTFTISNTITNIN